MNLLRPMLFAPALGLALALAALAGGAAVSPSAAEAKPLVIKSNGPVHACYKAKGKRKGAMRLVAKGKRCAKGERKLRINAKGKRGPRGVAGDRGARGIQGARGLQGPIGPQGAGATTLIPIVEQQAGEIIELNEQLASLKAVVDSTLPELSTLCDQLAAVTDQANLLRTVISGLGLNGVLTSLGGLLSIPTLPAALSPVGCEAFAT